MPGSSTSFVTVSLGFVNRPRRRRLGLDPGAEIEVSLSAQEGFRLIFLVCPLTEFVLPQPPRRPGWEVKRGRSVHGTVNPLVKPDASGRHRDKTFDTPFDHRGRCHHHPKAQMATKKVQGR